MTLRIKVTTPKQIGFLRDLWESYIPSINLTAVKLFELSCRNRCLQTDGQIRWTDGWMNGQKDRQTAL